MSDCRDLEGLTTPYVDGEGAPAERRIVEQHVATCPACRLAIEAEAGARRLLRAHARAIRSATAVAAPPRPPSRPWLALAPLRRLHRPTAMRVATLAGLAVLIFAVFHRPDVIDAVGVIGDSACGLRHYDNTSPAAARECTVNCVAHGAQFVFISQDVVYRIANQTFPALASHANVRVSVSGVFADGVLTLARVEAADPAANPNRQPKAEEGTP